MRYFLWCFRSVPVAPFSCDKTYMRERSEVGIQTDNKTANENPWDSAEHQRARSMQRHDRSPTQADVRAQRKVTKPPYRRMLELMTFAVRRSLKHIRTNIRSPIFTEHRADLKIEMTNFRRSRLAAGDVSVFSLRVGYFQSVRDMKAPIPAKNAFCSEHSRM